MYQPNLMNIMKKLTRGLNFLALISAVLLISSCASTKLPDMYEVDPEVLEAKGGTVEFTVTGTIPEKSFHKKAVVEFTPVLEYDGKVKELKKFVLKGEKAEGEGGERGGEPRRAVPRGEVPRGTAQYRLAFHRHRRGTPTHDCRACLSPRAQ